MTATPEGSRFNGLQVLAPALIAGVVPLAVLPGAFSPFHAGKWFVVLFAVPAGLAVCAAAGTLRWPLRNWFLAWIGVSVAATVLGVAPWMSIAGSPNRNAGLLGLLVGVGSFILGASAGSEPRAQRVILRSAFLAGGIVGVLAVLERAGLDLFGLGDVEGLTRARSTWGSATFAGSHLVMVLPIAVAHLRSRDLLWKRLAVAATAAIAAGLVLTGTRGAWLGALAAAGVMAPAWLQTGRSGRTVGRGVGTGEGEESGASTSPLPGNLTVRQLGFGFMGILVLVAAVMLMVPNLGRSSGVGRIDQLRTALPVIADRPILGSGPDTQRVVLPSGIDESFERDHGSEELHDRVHNIVFDTLVTTGVVGLIALSALGFALVRSVRGKLRNSLVPTAIAAGLVAYLVSLVFAFGDPVIDPIAWLLAGVLVIATTGESRATAEEAEPTTATATTSATPTVSRSLALSGSAVLVLVAAAGGVWAGGEVLSEYRLDSAMDAAATRELDVAADRLEEASAVAPARFDLDQIAARIGVQSINEGEPARGFSSDAVDETAKWAEQRLDRAQRVAGDDPDVLMDRAELLTAWQRPEAAVEVYEQLAELYPNSFRAQLGLGLAEAQLRHLDRAEVAWKRAAELGPGDARALVNLGLLHESFGDPDAALREFQQAVERDPDAPGAAAGIARVSAPEGG